MIARHETHMATVDIWSALAAKLPTGVISWRQDGRVVSRDGKHLARFVAYIEANTVRERLESVVPGEWDSTLELLPPLVTTDDDANQGACSFKCRLQILGVIREDVGTGKDYKQAATDAFKRAAVRFGIGHELYDYEQNWVQMDGDGKFARPIEDPGVAYARRYGKSSGANGVGVKSAVNDRRSEGDSQPGAVTGSTNATAPQQGAPTSSPDSMRTTDEPSCPKCGGRVWNNILTKRNPKAPDFKCRDRSCDGVIWPPKAQKAANQKSDEEWDQTAGTESEEIPY
jgi:hypothetical protein